VNPVVSMLFAREKIFPAKTQEILFELLLFLLMFRLSG
jgi:hypothetical protein